MSNLQRKRTLYSYKVHCCVVGLACFNPDPELTSFRLLPIAQLGYLASKMIM